MSILILGDVPGVSRSQNHFLIPNQITSGMVNLYCHFNIQQMNSTFAKIKHVPTTSMLYLFGQPRFVGILRKCLLLCEDNILCTSLRPQREPTPVCCHDSCDQIYILLTFCFPVGCTAEVITVNVSISNKFDCSVGQCTLEHLQQSVKSPRPKYSTFPNQKVQNETHYKCFRCLRSRSNK